MKLSICIPTYNRAHVIGQTLGNILPQLTEDVEVVISDNASTDGTGDVIRQYQEKFSNIVYSRAEENSGPDANAIRAVRLAQGDYCWFMADDDMIVDGGIQRLLNDYLYKETVLSMVLLTYTIYDTSMTKPLINSGGEIGVFEDILTTDSIDFFRKYFCELCMSAYVIHRQRWLDQNPERYLNTGIVILGAAYDSMNETSHVQLISKPLVKYRSNHLSWEDYKLEVLLSRVPKGISLVSNRYNSVKQEALNRYYRRFPVTLKMLMALRADGAYNWNLYSKYVRTHWKNAVGKKLLAACIAILPVRVLRVMRRAYIALKH